MKVYVLKNIGGNYLSEALDNKVYKNIKKPFQIVFSKEQYESIMEEYEEQLPEYDFDNDKSYEQILEDTEAMENFVNSYYDMICDNEIELDMEIDGSIQVLCINEVIED